MSADLSCYICTEPAVSPTTMMGCDPACSANHVSCYECLLSWCRCLQSQGAAFKCPCCKTVVTAMNVRDLSIASALASNASAVSMEVDDSEMAEEEEKEFDISYIAGVHEVALNTTKWLVVWCAEDVSEDEALSEWVELASVVESSSKVLEFLRRWNLPSIRPVGFRWEHAVPERTRDGVFKCTHDRCTYKTELDSNCRKHAGAVHSESFWNCVMCGEKCKTSSNLKKHIGRKHAPVASAE